MKIHPRSAGKKQKHDNAADDSRNQQHDDGTDSGNCGKRPEHRCDEGTDVGVERAAHDQTDESHDSGNQQEDGHTHDGDNGSHADNVGEAAVSE